MIAVVAGASRGCGRGVALALGSAGATVYVTGRTTRSSPGPVDGAPGTIEDVAEEVTARGGHGIAVAVDYRSAEEVSSLFERVRADSGRLDVLVSSVWGGNERFLDPVWNQPFWEQPTAAWSEHIDAGPAAFWLAAHGAARLMVERNSGLIVAISEPILENAFEGQQAAVQETFSHLAHYGINRLVAGLEKDGRAKGISVIGLLPGFMRTERVEMHLELLGESARQEFRYDLAESTEYAGRAVVALARDAKVLERSGKLVYVADLAEEYGFTDIDGKRVKNFYRELGLIR